MQTVSRPLHASAPALDRVLLARTEGALIAVLDATAASPRCPPGLAQALRDAVFPGGARLRPQLCLLTAMACGDGDPTLADAAACALELLHRASLVHHGEPPAVLAGDALIALAFETLARAAAAAPSRAARLMRALAVPAGPNGGMVAGARTGSLFEAAATMGALAGGGDPLQWCHLGELVGCAHQAAADLRELVSPTAAGSASALGVDATRARISALIEQALAAIPEGRGCSLVQGWIELLALRLDGAGGLARLRRRRR